MDFCGSWYFGHHNGNTGPLHVVRGKWSVVLEAIRGRKGAKETLTSVAKELLTPAEKASTIDKAPVSDPRSPRVSVASSYGDSNV